MNGQRGKRRSSAVVASGHQQHQHAGAARRREREERFANSKWGLAPSAEALPPPPPAWRRAGGPCRPELDRALPLKLLLNLATAMATKKLKHKAWEFFEVASQDDKMAICKLCSNAYSFKTTVGNLKKHLLHKHLNEVPPDVIEDGMDETITTDDNPLKRKSTDDSTEYLLDQSNVGNGEDNIDQDKAAKQKRKETGRGTRRSSTLWHFFEISSKREHKAECRLCQAVLSYKTSISNLKTHLSKKHPEVLKELDTLPSYSQISGEDGSENGDVTDDVSCKDEFNMGDYEVIEEVMVPDKERTFNGTDDDCEEETSMPSLFRNKENNKASTKYMTMPIGRSGIKTKTKSDPEPIDNWARSCEKFGAYAASLMLQMPRTIAAKYQVQIIQKLMEVALKYDGDGENDF